MFIIIRLLNTHSNSHNYHFVVVMVKTLKLYSSSHPQICKQYGSNKFYVPMGSPVLHKYPFKLQIREVNSNNSI